VDFGVSYFPTHDGIGPGPLARMVEERGFESLWFAEHTHIPASRETPPPGGGELPQRYWHCYDLFVALTAAACATSRLRVGSGICLVVERDPITTAAAVASIDHLSGGRMEFGIGAGWNREEMRNHGTDPRTRMRLMHERVEAMRAIWTQDEATYHGEFVNFDRIWSYPKPVQHPHPPVLVGGGGPGVLDRVLAFGDGWMPNYVDDDALLERIGELRARADRPLEVTIASVPANVRALERARRAGARRVMHLLPNGGLSVIEPALERWEAVIAELIGG
jgi:probable F420-dependent oxidoreductase